MSKGCWDIISKITMEEWQTYSSMISSGRLAKAHAACLASLESAMPFGAVVVGLSIFITTAVLARPQCA